MGRAHLTRSLDLTARVTAALYRAALAHAGGSLDDAAVALHDADVALDAVCKAVERARIAIGAEAAPAQPIQAEECAA
jgi:hypothetical protein